MPLSNEQIQQQAKVILNDPEFQRVAVKEQNSEWLKKLLEWLNFKWKFPFENEAKSWMFSTWGFAFKLIIIGALIVALVYLIRFIISKVGQETGRQQPFQKITYGQRHEANESFTSLSLKAFQAQDYRLAMHYLLLATVSLVIQDTHFHEAQYLTNREIIQATDFSTFQSADLLKTAFEEMVYFDESHWFGKKQSILKDYEAFLQLYSPFRQMVESQLGTKRMAS